MEERPSCGCVADQGAAPVILMWRYGRASKGEKSRSASQVRAVAALRRLVSGECGGDVSVSFSATEEKSLNVISVADVEGTTI